MSTLLDKYIAYFPEFSSTALQEFVGNRVRLSNIPVLRLFLARYKAFPCLSKCPRIETNFWFHVPSVLNYLKTQYGHNADNDAITRKYHKRAKQFHVAYVF
jgi:hypothetical protein